MEPPLYVVSSWIIRVYTILVWNTISGSSNLDNCFYHCLILISISHLKALFNLLLLLLLLLLFIIYIVNLPEVRPRSCWVIYYFDTPTLGRRHQSFGLSKTKFDESEELRMIYSLEEIEDKKGTENVDANLLSRVTTDSTSNITPINDYFPDESLFSISTMPWYANIVNFLVSGQCRLIGVPKTKESSWMK